MILHTVNASVSSSAFADCTAVVQPGDAVVLMGDAVYAAVASTAGCETLLASGIELYLLDTDALARGVLGSPDSTRMIDMPGLVALTERFTRQLAWY